MKAVIDTLKIISSAYALLCLVIMVQLHTGDVGMSSVLSHVETAIVGIQLNQLDTIDSEYLSEIKRIKAMRVK